MRSEHALIRNLESSTIKAENMHYVEKQDAKDLLESIRKLVPVVEGTLDAITKKALELRSASMDRQVNSYLKKLEVLVEKYGNSLVTHMLD
jgi:hypothetical protein